MSEVSGQNQASEFEKVGKIQEKAIIIIKFFLINAFVSYEMSESNILQLNSKWSTIKRL